MPLAPVDFSNVKELELIPAGTRVLGMTKSWEAKPSKAGDSTNIEAKFTFEYDGLQRTHVHRWNLKPGALWRVKRDFIKMGADPADLEGPAVDLEAILDEFFSSPLQVWLTFGLGEPYETNDVDPETGLKVKRQNNELTAIEAYS